MPDLRVVRPTSRLLDGLERTIASTDGRVIDANQYAKYVDILEVPRSPLVRHAKNIDIRSVARAHRLPTDARLDRGCKLE